MAVASLVLGIIATVTCYIPIFGFALALVSLIISIVAMCSKKLKDKQNGFKIAGLVLSIIAFIVSLIMTVIPMIILFQNLSTNLIV